MLRRGGRAGLPADLVGRGAGPGRRRIRGDAGRCGVYLTSRGMPNENYYVAQKAVRAMGTNAVDNAARICHSPSRRAQADDRRRRPRPARTGDWIGTDLIVFIGANPANNQPVATKYMYHAKKAGTKIVMVNTYREPGMERYWVPSNVESALFGTKIADEFFLDQHGRRHRLPQRRAQAHDRERLGGQGLRRASTPPASTSSRRASRSSLGGARGAGRGDPRARCARSASMLGEAKTAVLVWSMGVTQHAFGEDNVRGDRQSRR